MTEQPFLYNKGGVVVTREMFTADSLSFPIRNISSVGVGETTPNEKPYLYGALFGALVCLPGLISGCAAYGSTEANANLIGTVIVSLFVGISIIVFSFWLMSKFCPTTYFVQVLSSGQYSSVCSSEKIENVKEIIEAINKALTMHS